MADFAGTTPVSDGLHSTSPVFVDQSDSSFFVKGLGFLIRLGFQKSNGDWSFITSESHPFVKILSCRSDLEDELVKQLFLFTTWSYKHAEMAEVCSFLRPFLNYNVLRLSNLEVWFQRPKDIVRKLLSGDLDLGIASLDTVTEYAPGSEDLIIIHDALDYGECHLSLTIPKYGIFENVNSLKELAQMPQWSKEKPLRVATGFTYVRNFLQLLAREVVEIPGRV